MIDFRRAWVLAVPVFLGSAIAAGAQSTKRYHPLPAAFAGDWEGVDAKEPHPSLPADLKIEPAFDAADPLIVSHLTPWAREKRDATSYDSAPGSLCDPEGWFPFINYGYGFALLSSPGKITIIPVEPDTEGIRRVYLVANHPKTLTPTWNGNSIAHWEGETLVIDTVGYNDLSWLGDDREPHTTELHMVEQLRLVDAGKFLEITYHVSDPKALTAPYQLRRYFSRVNAPHVGAGPDRDDIEWVCNEDLSPFTREATKPPEDHKQ